MHELSIAVGIVEAVAAEAETRGFGKVTTVYLRLGALAGVDRDALLFSFPIACEGTLVEGAQLVIEDVPTRVACGACGSESAPGPVQALTCARCGSPATHVVAGREIQLRAFEAVEEEVRT